MDAIRIGFIGAGGIFPTHAEALQNIPGVELTAVCDVDGTQARAQAERFDIPLATEDVRELLGRNLDAVFVLTPPRLHAEQTIAALNAGLHVFVEKPLASSLEDGQRIVEAARASDRVVQMGFNNLFEPACRQMWSMFRSGELGRLVRGWDRHTQFRATDSWTNPDRRDTWRLSQAESGGRMQEFGSHKVHWLMSVGGSVSSLMGRSDAVAATLAERGIDDTVLLMMDFAGGGVGTVEVSLAPTVRAERSIGLQGTEATVEWDGGEKLVLTKRDSEESSELALSAVVESRHEHFIRCIREGTQQMEHHATPEFAMEVLQVCLGFLESAESASCWSSRERGERGS